MDDTFKLFFKALSDEDKLDFATRCGSSVGYFVVSISRRQNFKAGLCVLIERESGGAVSRKNLRPADWHLVWPELVSESA